MARRAFLLSSITFLGIISGVERPARAQFPAVMELRQLDGVSGFTILGADYAHLTGLSVSWAGDVNKDGVDDLLVGAPGGYSGPNYPEPEGRAYVFFGGRQIGREGVIDLRWPTSGAGWTLILGEVLDSTGASVSFAGDVNADGIDDLVVGAPDADAPLRPWTGQAYLFFGGPHLSKLSLLRPSDLDGTDGIVVSGTRSGAQTGNAVTNCGDLNDDGYADFAVATWLGNPGGRRSAGQVHVIFGGPKVGATPNLYPTLLNGTNGFSVNGILENDRAGWGVARGGDVNDDGVDDLIIGAPWADPAGRNRAGQAYVVFGRSGIGAGGLFELSDLDTSNGFVINGVAPEDQAGRTVCGGADLDADGVPDVVIGSWPSGDAYVIRGGQQVGASGVVELSALDGRAGFVVRLANGERGVANVGRPGDFNDDGVADLIIGSIGLPWSGQYRDVALVVFGREGLGSGGVVDATALGGREGFFLISANADWTGASVSTAGDVNGDGIDDLAIGAPFWQRDGIWWVGRAFVVFGRRLGDLDLDGDVDLADFLIFQRCFGGEERPPTPECPTDVISDLDYDGDVDLADFLIFQQNFTGSR